MATVSGEREGSDGGVSTERINGLRESVRKFLERATPHYVTIPHVMIQGGMSIIEVNGVWDNDSLESLTVASWRLSPLSTPKKLTPEARISYKYPGDAENGSWEHSGAIDDLWINKVEAALNVVAEGKIGPLKLIRLKTTTMP
jgi:hypothetical protein